jgi:hypothetical protein
VGSDPSFTTVHCVLSKVALATGSSVAPVMIKGIFEALGQDSSCFAFRSSTDRPDIQNNWSARSRFTQLHSRCLSKFRGRSNNRRSGQSDCACVDPRWTTCLICMPTDCAIINSEMPNDWRICGASDVGWWSGHVAGLCFFSANTPQLFLNQSRRATEGFSGVFVIVRTIGILRCLFLL